MTFVKASHSYIIPGIRIVNKLGMNTIQKDNYEEIIQGLAQYSKEAQMKIHDLVEEVWVPLN